VTELTNTIMRDLPRLRDTEAISRDIIEFRFNKSKGPAGEGFLKKRKRRSPRRRAQLADRFVTSSNTFL
jgi:hypothetical protein